VSIWVVEGKYMKRKEWEFVAVYETRARALFEAARSTRGLHPVWQYRVCEYKPAGKPEPPVPFVRGA